MNDFKCLLCDSKRNEVFLEEGKDFEYGVGGKFKLVRCTSCGLISLSPKPSIEQLLSFYPASYHSYNAPISRVTKFLGHAVLKQRARKIEKLIGNRGKILDVGCADGEHFDDLRKFGSWQFIGIDFNDKIVERGRKGGREIYTATLEDFNYPKESFDLVIMDHLLEHVPDPAATLNSACRLLKSGGCLVGAVPNINSLDRILSGRFWGGYHLPRHVYHFNSQTLEEIFEKHRFKVTEIGYDLHTGHWALSVQNFFQSLKPTKTKIEQGRTFYYSSLLLLFLPLNLLQKLCHCTGVISFTAQKS